MNARSPQPSATTLTPQPTPKRPPPSSPPTAHPTSHTTPPTPPPTHPTKTSIPFDPLDFTSAYMRTLDVQDTHGHSAPGGHTVITPARAGERVGRAPAAKAKAKR